MIWNPTSDIDPNAGLGDPVFGGGHFIFIFDRNGNDPSKGCPHI